MSETTASRLAEHILSRFQRRGTSPTNLKLQKLLYYCQAWHLAIADRPLFDDDIEAWVHGPVVPRVFGRFKSFRWNPITESFGEVRLYGGPEERTVEAHVHEVLNAYAHLSGSQLETLTHREMPWREARAGLANDEPSNNVISLDSMKFYYREQLHSK